VHYEFVVSGNTLNVPGTGVVRIYANGVLKASQNVTISNGFFVLW
jgi:hypothetical protein